MKTLLTRNRWLAKTGTKPLALIRSHPLKARVAGVVLVGIITWSAIQLWALARYRSAARAFEEDRLAEAHADIQACLRFWPGSARAHLLAARIQRLSGAFQQAAEHLKECKRLEGISESTQLEWVLLRAQTGEVAQVEKSLHDCVERQHPETPLILTALARGFMDDTRYRAAYGCLNELLQRQPDDIRGLRWRGWIREHLDDLPGAIEDYRRALDRAPDNWRVRLRLLEALLQNKNTHEVARQAEILARTHGNDPDVRLALARCRLLQGENEQAKEILDRLLVDQPNLGAALYYRGKLEATDPAAAERWYRRALEAEPGLNEPRFALYFSLQQQGKNAEASALLAAYKGVEANAKKLTEILLLLERSPRNVDLLTQAGELFLQIGNDYAGKQFLYRALDADPRCGKAHAILGRHFTARKETKRASYHTRMAANP